MIDVGGIVHAHANPGFLRQRGEAGEFRGADNFVADQHVADAAFHHCLGLTYFLTADADRSGSDLPVGDFRTLVALRMRAQAHRAGRQRRRQAPEVAFERIEIEQQGGRVDVGKRLANRGGTALRHDPDGFQNATLPDRPMSAISTARPDSAAA
ncbi:MAG: hypothetical protein WDM96_04945 [Lacunisphaera sp.]